MTTAARTTTATFQRAGDAPAPLRVALLADMLEEGWPSMDLVADMLGPTLARNHAHAISAECVRPSMRRGVTGTFSSLPSRSTTKVSGFPAGACEMTRTTSSQVRTGSPPIFT